MIIWITGLSASGKTTLSRAFEKKYKNKFPNLVLLDGDLIRDLYGNDLGFKKSDRILQIKRLQSIALFLEKQSIIVIVAALYSDHNLLEMNRKLFDDYFEIYLKADVAQLQKREFKDLYKNALNGRIKDVVGIDIPWNEPKNPDLIFKIWEEKSPDEMAKIMFDNIFS